MARPYGSINTGNSNIETGILPVVQIKTVLNWIQRGHTARARVQARRPLGLGPTPGAGGALGARAGRQPRLRNGIARSGTVLSRLAGHWVSDLPVSESNPPILQCTFSVGLPTGSCSSLDFSVSQCALFRFIPGFKRDKNCLETESKLFRYRAISVSERKIFLFPPQKNCFARAFRYAAPQGAELFCVCSGSRTEFGFPCCLGTKS